MRGRPSTATCGGMDGARLRGATNGAPAEYGVAWRTEGGAVARGSLQLQGSSLLLRGATQDGSIVRRRIRLDDVVSVEIGRGPFERIQAARTVVLKLRHAPGVAIAPGGAGEVFELAELVAELSSPEAAARERVAVVLPLRRGTAALARELISVGPPFDLDQAGLERHHVFITEREAIFLFEGPGARETLERLVLDPQVRRTAARWRRCLAGRPRIAEESYAWRRGG